MMGLETIKKLNEGIRLQHLRTLREELAQVRERKVEELEEES